MVPVTPHSAKPRMPPIASGHAPVTLVESVNTKIESSRHPRVPTQCFGGDHTQQEPFGFAARSMGTGHTYMMKPNRKQKNKRT